MIVKSLNKKDELSQWSKLNNEIVKTKIEIRIHEKIILEAKSLHLKPDLCVERELKFLKDMGALIT